MIGSKIEVIDESKAEYGQFGTIIDYQAGVEHLLVSVTLNKGGQRLFTACSLSSGGCKCKSTLHQSEAPTTLLG